SRTKHGADKIVRFLEAAGIKSNAIHGNKSQGQRERALGLFRTGDVKVLIATDIAARGIDIPGVSHVVNFDLPDVPEQYVHRIGRTARAGASGQAIAFCSRDERVNLKDIEKLVRIKLPEAALPEGFMAAVEAIKRLKPAPKQTDSRERQPHGGRRFTPTASLKPGHSRGGPRRDGQNSSGPRTNPLRDNDAQPQRHPQRADGHNAHRPANGPGTGQPKRPFGSRGGRGRGRPGGNTGQRAHG
ncbi:MAG: DEAD/DEAH box helicase, partial [Sphingomicrobium sp.]